MYVAIGHVALVLMTQAEEAVEERVGITIDEMASWLLIGLLVGTIASAIYLKRSKGFGLFGNLLIGLAGAFVAGLVTELIGLDFNWGQIVLGVDELIFAMAGAIAVLFALTFLKNRGKPGAAK
jgi:uncharacterized membrane protein YeaQ/YmgE (transglycosylase-associated protein family)